MDRLVEVVVVLELLLSPSGAIFEAISRLDHKCTNNQIE
jgi:hypothetical protein